MAGARHLKEDLLLAFEKDFSIIDAAGGVHQAVRLNQLFPAKSFVKLGFLVAIGHQGQLRVGFCRGHPV